MSEHASSEDILTNAVTRMRIAVPCGRGTLLVTPDIPTDNHTCSEIQLLQIGRAVFGKPLTQEYGWRGEGQISYIADPIDIADGAMRQLTRHLYEQAHIPEVPSVGHRVYHTPGLALSAVRILPLRLPFKPI